MRDENVHTPQCVLSAVGWQDLLDVNSLELARQLTIALNNHLRDIRVSDDVINTSIELYTYSSSYKGPRGRIEYHIDHLLCLSPTAQRATESRLEG